MSSTRGVTIGIAATLCLALAAGAASAQFTPFGPPTDKKDNSPLEITADGTLEWLQTERAYVARKNAIAKRNGSEVHADTLTAFYRDAEKKPDAAAPAGTPAKKPSVTPAEGDPGDIFRVVAEGSVKIENAGRSAFADRAVYDVDKKVVVLTGGDLRVVTPLETVRAKDSIEYWEESEVAVARGKAIARKNNDTLAGDVLVARFVKDDKGATQMQKVDAYGNVVITTVRDTVRGGQGTYDMRTRKATIIGPAKFGAAAPPGAPAPGTPPGKPSPPRVRGLFVPKDSSALPTPTAAEVAPQPSVAVAKTAPPATPPKTSPPKTAQ